MARAVWTDRAPIIDGALDEPEWRSAPAFGGLTEREPRLRATPPVRTTFRVLFDARAIYVGVHCQDDQPARIRANIRTRDRFDMFHDDVKYRRQSRRPHAGPCKGPPPFSGG